MNLDAIDAAVIIARGQYATVNGEFKTAMSLMQELTQRSCDMLRQALQSDSERTMHLDTVRRMLDSLEELDVQISALKVQKDELWQAAWGKK
jgi:polyhydroxyalkanoate synthesis regulator protein